MKTKQVLIACFIIFSHISLFGQKQDRIKELPNEIIEATTNTYKVEVSEIGYTVTNTKNKLINIAPKFLEYWNRPEIGVSNRAVFDDFVRHNFKPYFVNCNSFTYMYLYFYLFADRFGNIKEIEIRYPKNIGLIPLSVIERFERSLLNSNVKLTFDKNYSAFKGSEWVGRPVMYEAEKVKDL